jgi:predicted phosphohydrolase
MSHFSVWVIGDLHLSFGVPNKEMDLFGPSWKNHADTVKAAWDTAVAPDDIVLIPGDISWAMRLEEALPDLAWIDERPGTKILIKGNHDYWWGSLTKVRAALPKSIRVIQHDAVDINGIAIGGTRLWETSEFHFNSIADIKPTATPPKAREEGKDEEIYRRELGRLETSLQHLPKEAALKIVMTHYPPIGIDLAPSSASSLFERYGISLVVFGHLHSFKKGLPHLFGTARGVRYVLASCDYLNFSPLCVVRDGIMIS